MQISIGNGVGDVVEIRHQTPFVFATQITLDNFGAVISVQKLAVDFGKHRNIHQVVGIKEKYSIIVILIAFQGFKRFFEHNGFARCLIWMILLKLKYLCPCFFGNFRRVVGAIVGQNVVVKQMTGILHLFHIANDTLDHALFIVGRNEHQKPHLGVKRSVVFGFLSKAKQTDDELKEQRNGHPSEKQIDEHR